MLTPGAKRVAIMPNHCYYGHNRTDEGDRTLTKRAELIADLGDKINCALRSKVLFSYVFISFRDYILPDINLI